jgi:hypothetical protein
VRRDSNQMNAYARGGVFSAKQTENDPFLTSPFQGEGKNERPFAL